MLDSAEVKLAVLNARSSVSQDLAVNSASLDIRKSISDVDVNYDTSIDIKDLAMLDKQWGSSLHTNNPLSNNIFTGSDSQIDLSKLDLVGNLSIDNSAFISQNTIENSETFVDSLASPGTAGYSETDITESYGGLHDANTSNTP